MKISAGFSYAEKIMSQNYNLVHKMYNKDACFSNTGI
jgi:hypothetical protein